MWLRAMAKYRERVPFLYLCLFRRRLCFVSFSFLSGRLPKSEGQSGAAKCCPGIPFETALAFAANFGSRNEIHIMNSKLIPRTVQAIATESRLESINLLLACSFRQIVFSCG